jgi:hypothetical protein
MQLVADTDERVWMGLAQKDGEADLWLVLRADDQQRVGVYGSLSLPAGLVALRFHGNAVYATKLTSDGVPVLQEYRLRGFERARQ